MFIIFSLLALISGAFIPFIILFLLIIVHEFGHFFTAIILGITPDKIYIYPFGGVSKFNISLNEKIAKEFIILLMGPLLQFLFATFLMNISFFDHYKNIINIYNYTILGFNLLPIYPLDGGKLLNIVLSISNSFRKSLLITLVISYITVFIFGLIFLFKDFSINIIIIISFLIYKVNIEWKNKEYLNDKFLLERYLYKYKFKKRKYINNINEFMREKNHLVKIDGKYHTEREVLSNKFNNKY